MKKILGISVLTITSLIILNSCSPKESEKQKDLSEENISLKNLYKEDFYIGAAINDYQIGRTDTLGLGVLENEFNTITPENIMKWMYVHPKENEFYFEETDKYVALGLEKNMFIVGHTLIWHSQIADWMNEVTDSTVMAKHFKNHINNIVSRYKGKIDSWDVVNEALNEDGTLRESSFLKVMGNDYIDLAFKLAAKADPKAELVYNDYNLWKPKKREGVVRLVKQLQANGTKIDGVGMQAHWSLEGPSIEDIENSILAYSELGVKVMFTELDVTVLPNPWDLNGAAVEQNYDKFEGDPIMNPYPESLPDSIQLKLAKRYEAIFNLFLKHKEKIGRVTFWGVNDGQSWLNGWPIKNRTNYPLLFDRNYKPKKAYNSVLELKNTSN